MKKKVENKYLLNTNLDLQNTYFLDQIKTTNINILLNRVKVEKKNNFKKKLYFFLIMSLTIFFFLAIVISI